MADDQHLRVECQIEVIIDYRSGYVSNHAPGPVHIDEAHVVQLRAYENEQQPRVQIR